jgi:eukaryotic-like serine/threonine-protein kinase
MTPERWQQIGELFKTAVRIDPAGREAWVLAACGGDDELRAEVTRLLANDERADRVGLLTPPGPIGPPSDQTESRSPRVEASPQWPGPVSIAGAALALDTKGFTPRQVIGPQAVRHKISEPPDIVRARLRELPIVYILLLAASALWRRAVLGEEDPTLYRVDGMVILALVVLIALLWSRWPVTLAGLKALELGMIGLLAGRVALAQYRMMLEFSLRADQLMAQLTLKNIVLLTSVLILTYGLYVPKSWRRAAVVVGPLALLPFATLSVLALRHPTATAWLWKG